MIFEMSNYFCETTLGILHVQPVRTFCWILETLPCPDLILVLIYCVSSFSTWNPESFSHTGNSVSTSRPRHTSTRRTQKIFARFVQPFPESIAFTSAPPAVTCRIKVQYACASIARVYKLARRAATSVTERNDAKTHPSRDNRVVIVLFLPFCPSE